MLRIDADQQRGLKAVLKGFEACSCLRSTAAGAYLPAYTDKLRIPVI
jgi:hypothetical protein